MHIPRRARLLLVGTRSSKPRGISRPPVERESPKDTTPDSPDLLSGLEPEMIKATKSKPHMKLRALSSKRLSDPRGTKKLALKQAKKKSRVRASLDRDDARQRTLKNK